MWSLPYSTYLGFCIFAASNFINFVTLIASSILPIFVLPGFVHKLPQMEDIKKGKHDTVALLQNLCEQTIRKTIAIRV